MAGVGARHQKWFEYAEEPQQHYNQTCSERTRVHVSLLNGSCQHLINAWHHCAFRLDKLREIADGWTPYSEITLFSLLGDIGTRDFYFDIKDLVCIMLGILLPVGMFDGVDCVHSLMKRFGHHFRDRHVLCSRYRLNFSLHVSKAIKIQEWKTCASSCKWQPSVREPSKESRGLVID